MSRPWRAWRTAATAGLAFLAASMAAQTGLPATPKRPVVDEYHGVRVADPYRWLEDWNDPSVRAWSEQQNAYTRAQLDALPFMPSVRARVATLGKDTHPTWSDARYAGKRTFAIKRQPPKEQPVLVVYSSVDDLSTERVIVDPNVRNPSGTTAIDFYVPSPDGRLVAVSMSEGGTESGDVHVFETDTGRERPDQVRRVNGGTAGGSVAWSANDRGFYYTRYPRPGQRPQEDLDFYQQIYFHGAGSPASADEYSLGKDFPRIAEAALASSRDGRFILASVGNGDGGEIAQYVLPPRGAWVRVAAFTDQAIAAAWGRDDALYVLSRKGAPRGRILRLDVGHGRTALGDARVVVAESDAAIQNFAITDNRLYVHSLAGGPSRIDVFDLHGGAEPSINLPPVSSVESMVGLDGDELLFSAQQYVSPAAFYRVAPGGEPKKTALVATPAVDYGDIEVAREEATSRDGTRVPITILARKGTPRDGRNPTVLYGYGGYSISMQPHFSAILHAWLEQGGVYAEANLRGGGEFGEAWHLAGNLTRKQNVFDDFEAAARHLIAARYASAGTLAIEGGSNGGLLMGAALTQHPELFRAVVSHVGIYDMLRYELWPNGAFNVTEFGSVKDPTQFKALFAYSPYHHVVEGIAYPAVLLLSGTNDARVNPADSRKLAARLQAATASTRPVLLRISGSGHGFGTSLSDNLAQQADRLAFLLWQLGVTVRE
jgi:prolyl oligopeptidase